MSRLNSHFIQVGVFRQPHAENHSQFWTLLVCVWFFFFFFGASTLWLFCAKMKGAPGSQCFPQDWTFVDFLSRGAKHCRHITLIVQQNITYGNFLEIFHENCVPLCLIKSSLKFILSVSLKFRKAFNVRKKLEKIFKPNDKNHLITFLNYMGTELQKMATRKCMRCRSSLLNVILKHKMVYFKSFINFEIFNGSWKVSESFGNLWKFRNWKFRPPSLVK
jgi:hypothetical protein